MATIVNSNNSCNIIKNHKSKKLFTNNDKKNDPIPHHGTKDKVNPHHLQQTNANENNVVVQKNDETLNSHLATHQLRPGQCKALCDLLCSPVYIHAQGSSTNGSSVADGFPEIQITLIDAIIRVKERLEAIGIPVTDVRVNGGAASHTLSADLLLSPLGKITDKVDGDKQQTQQQYFNYNDLDLLFFITLKSGKDLERIKNVVLDLIAKLSIDASKTSSSAFSGSEEFTYQDFPPLESVDDKNLACKKGRKPKNAFRKNFYNTVDNVSGPLSPMSKYIQNQGIYANRSLIRELYVHKMVKVCSGHDVWSLIALNNLMGRNLEFKFVSTMRRQFEFSVDSFQIILDPILNVAQDFLRDSETSSEFSQELLKEKIKTIPIYCESVYGDYTLAEKHLRERHIATVRPEEIRGGGLLKYCHLLVQGFKPEPSTDFTSLEKYMCSRFFIDFGDVTKQKAKLESYIRNHFPAREPKKSYDYLVTLYRVVDESTVCLMGHERREILKLIERLFYQAYYNALIDSNNNMTQAESKSSLPHNVFSKLPLGFSAIQRPNSLPLDNNCMFLSTNNFNDAHSKSNFNARSHQKETVQKSKIMHQNLPLSNDKAQTNILIANTSVNQSSYSNQYLIPITSQTLYSPIICSFPTVVNMCDCINTIPVSKPMVDTQPQSAVGNNTLNYIISFVPHNHPIIGNTGNGNGIIYNHANAQTFAHEYSQTSSTLHPTTQVISPILTTPILIPLISSVNSAIPSSQYVGSQTTNLLYQQPTIFHNAVNFIHLQGTAPIASTNSDLISPDSLIIDSVSLQNKPSCPDKTNDDNDISDLTQSDIEPKNKRSYVDEKICNRNLHIDDDDDNSSNSRFSFVDEEDRSYADTPDLSSVLSEEYIISSPDEHIGSTTKFCSTAIETKSSACSNSNITCSPNIIIVNDDTEQTIDINLKRHITKNMDGNNKNQNQFKNDKTISLLQETANKLEMTKQNLGES